MESAPSQSRAEFNGDQPTRTTPSTASIDEEGSKSIVQPHLVRAGAVNRSTSGFVEVLTTAPGATRTFGMTTDEVFPDRDGPSTRAERSGPVHAHPPPPIPR